VNDVRFGFAPYAYNTKWYATAVFIKVTVLTGQKREELEVRSSSHLKISVREKPERNAANKRMLELVARHFHTTPASVRIINGHRSPSKMLSLLK
jgi:uncharacterized protein YggU (UPF0235/DUF167 family)